MNTRAPWMSRNPLLTAFLVVLWLALVIYAFASGDPLAWVLAGIFLFAVAIPTAAVFNIAPPATGPSYPSATPHPTAAHPARADEPMGLYVLFFHSISTAAPSFS